jgi:predicted phosphodiesterase
VAHIVHAGDIGRPDIIVGLRRIAPVIAIRGNVDTDHWAERYPDTKMVRVGGRSIYVLHDIHELQLDPASCGVDRVMLEGNLSYSGPISGARNNATARSSRKKNRTIVQQPSA